MKKSFVSKLLACSMAGVLSISSFVGTFSFTSYAEEDSEVVTKSFTLSELVCNTSLTSQKASLGSSSNVSFDIQSNQNRYVADIAPVYPGYHLERADYKKGYSNYTGIDYFFLKPYTVKATGETDYSVYIHYTGSAGTSDLTTSAAHSKGTYLFCHYALNNYKVTYKADEDVTNVPVDENTYTIENSDSITISSEVPAKVGYNFDGWILEENGALYQPGDSVSLSEVTNEDVSFVASFTEAAVPTSNIDINSEVVTSWNDQVQLNVTVTNSSDAVVKNWKIAFDFDGTIDQIWNAEVVSSENGSYVISHPSWKTDLAAGESYTFGLIATKTSENVPEVSETSLVSKEESVDMENVNVSLTKQEWSYGYNGEIKIENNTDSSLDGWTIEFDFADEITNIWNANIISHEGNHYVIENAGHNGSIASSSNVSFGFSAVPADGAEYSSAELSNVSLTAVR
ncbi:MAG: cellulose binding domain-containing protein [Butyrivibrio sp.]|uniref:cellulose binding domain-containing protein n=1 Tax=Butyrivibrio sp. TaxID=28121 RepID=UPI001B09DEC0|nr:cellulose binding domain-containing protein [Butyrivibrio sp.]MBO6242381.1 cellulose binding domain-containing protein [Butyrivibrio sp.]